MRLFSVSICRRTRTEDFYVVEANTAEEAKAMASEGQGFETSIIVEQSAEDFHAEELPTGQKFVIKEIRTSPERGREHCKNLSCEWDD